MSDRFRDVQLSMFTRLRSSHPWHQMSVWCSQSGVALLSLLAESGKKLAEQNIPWADRLQSEATACTRALAFYKLEMVLKKIQICRMRHRSSSVSLTGWTRVTQKQQEVQPDLYLWQWVNTPILDFFFLLLIQINGPFCVTKREMCSWRYPFKGWFIGL